MTDKEENTVLTAFEKQWDILDASNSLPQIAFISRKEVGKDKLNDIDDILHKARVEDLVIGIARITDSRYAHVKRYSALLSLTFTVKTFPSYREVKNNKFIEKKEPVKEEKQENLTNYSSRYEKSYGYASIFSMLGLLFISLGCTLIIILRYYGYYV